MKDKRNRFNSPFLGYLLGFVALVIGCAILPIAFALKDNPVGCAFVLTILHASEFVCLFCSFYFPYLFNKNNKFKWISYSFSIVLSLMLIVAIALEASLLAS